MTGASAPYVLFMGFPSRDAAGLAAWTAFRELVGVGAGLGVVAEPTRSRVARSPHTVGHQVGIWRLLAPNNREIGRSAFLFGTFAAARTNVSQLKEQTAEMIATPFHGPTSGSHGWFVSVSGRLVFTCARWYETASLSLEAAAGAIAAFRHAHITEHPRRPASRQAGESSASELSW